MVSIIDDKSNFTMIYAPGDRSRVVANKEVNAHLKVGWYKDIALKDNKLIYSDEEIYLQLINFVTTYGTLNSGNYKVMSLLPNSILDDGTEFYGSISLIYNTSTKELELEIFEVFDQLGSNPTFSSLLYIFLPQKSNMYNFRFMYDVDYPSYTLYEDIFMESKGRISIPQEEFTYIDEEYINTQKIILGGSFYSKANSDSLVYLVLNKVYLYGDDIFDKNNVDLSLEFFGFNTMD